MLGAHQAEALRAVAAGALGVLRVIGVGPHPETPELVRPFQNLAEMGVGDVRDHRRQGAEEDLAGRPVEGDEIAFLDHVVAHPDLAGAEIDVELGDADHGRLAELARHQRRVAGAAAAAGEDAFGGEHAVHVVGLGLRPHHDDRPVALLRPGDGGIGVEGDHADGGARRDVEALGDQPRLLAGGRLELRMQEEFHLLRLDAAHRLFLVDEAFVDHVDGDAHFGLGRALAVARLQDPQLVVFDGELDVLHVAVVLLQPSRDLDEFAVALRQRRLQVGQGLGLADAGDHVLALGVDQIIAFRLQLAGRCVARHGDAGGAIVAHVAEHHGLDVDGGAEVMGDVGRVAIGEGALAVPGLEHRLGGEAELFDRIVGEFVADIGAHDLAELPRHLAPVLGLELGVGFHLGVAPPGGDDRLEDLVGNAEHDAAEHLHQTPIGIEDEARILGALDQPLGDDVIEPEVEDGVHHAGHRELGARAAGDQQRTLRVAEGLSRGALELAKRVELLFPQIVGQRLTRRQIGVAAFGGDGEAGRHRHAEAGHVGQIGALAAEERPHLVPAAGVGLSLVDFAEEIDPFLHGRPLTLAFGQLPESRPRRTWAS